MIELSKCPNCASEDRVTIAGKDFCMHCGTASEDNAMIAASGAQANPTPDVSSNSPVSKFSSSDASPNDPIAQSPAPQPASDVISQQTQVVASPVTESPIAQQVNSAVSSDASAPQSLPSVTPPAQELPAASTIPVQVTPTASNAQPNQALNPITQNPSPIQAPVVPASAETASSNQASQAAIAQTAAIASADNKIAELTSADTATMGSADTVISTLPQEKSSDNLAGALAFASTQNNPTAAPATPPQLALAQGTPVPPTGIATPVSDPVSKTMPGAASAMTLDKAEPGVFSDEELHALSNTTVDSPIAPPVNSNVQGQIGVSTPAVTSTPPLDQSSLTQQPMVPAMPAAQPNNQLPPVAVAQVASADNNETAQKQTGSKKVLKPLGVAASIALLFVAGYYMWRVNYPSLSFKIASSKAGINATLPGYIPEGYGVKGNIQANPGSVSYSLVNQGNKKIAISQAKTDWDSQALAENYVSPKAENYLAIQAQGLTIYMMGSNQASWVNKGTWYRIESPDQALTQEQVVKLATSL